MTKNQQQTIAIAVGIVLATFLGAYVLVIGPQWKSSKELNLQTANLTGEATTAQAQAATLRAQAANLDATVDQMDQLLAQFPTEINQQELLGLIIDAADKAGLSLKSISPSVPGDPAAVNNLAGQTGATSAGAPITVAAPVGQYPVALSLISISASGSIEAQQKFLAYLEELDRPLTVRSVAVRGSELTLVARSYLTRPLAAPNEDGSTSEGQAAQPAPAVDPNASVPPVPGVSPAG